MSPPKTDPITAIRERGCAVLIVLLVTLPLWVISFSARGPLFVIGALIVLLVVVFGLGALGRLFRRD